MAREPILADFLELVQIDVVSRKERLAADLLKKKLSSIGCQVWEDEAGKVVDGDAGNVLAVLDGGAPGAVLLCAHMDRVGNGLGIKPIRRDGMILSDGSTILAADDMAGVAAILDGLRRVVKNGRPFPRVEVLFTICEEAGLLGSQNLNTKPLQAKRCYTFDSPGRIGRLINAAPTAASIQFKVYGKSAHAGNEPENGIDALKTAAAILASAKTGRLDSDTTANFSTLTTGGDNTGSVCDYVEVKGGARSLDNEKLIAYTCAFQILCKNVAQSFGARVEVDVVYRYQGFHIPEESKTVQIAAEALKEMSIPVLINASGGGMDANELNLRGIESIGVATGYAANHTVRENLVEADLLRCGELVEKIIYHCIEA